MKKEELVRRAMLKLGLFLVTKDLKELMTAKKSPKFSLKEYTEKKYADKATEFLVWVLQEIEKGNPLVKAKAKDLVKEIRAFKGDLLVNKYLSTDTLQKLDLMLHVI